MKLNFAEQLLVNNRVRAAVQRFYEGPSYADWAERSIPRSGLSSVTSSSVSQSCVNPSVS